MSTRPVGSKPTRAGQAGPFLIMLASMLSTHLGAAVAKTLFGSVGAAGMSALRLLFAAVVLLILLRPRLDLPRSAWRTVLVYGVALGCMNMLFYQALQRVHLGVAVTLEFSGPLVLATLSSRKPIDFLWIVLAGIGISLLWPRAGVSDVDPIGAAFAVAAGACWAFYIYFGRSAGISHGASMAALGTTVAAMLALPVAMAATPISDLFSLRTLPLAFAVAMLSAAIPYSLEMSAMARLPTKTSGTIMSLQPAFGALTGLVVLGEQLTAAQWIAVALVIAASVGAAVTAGRAGAVQPLDGA